jgi:8-oxo-dGTP diphosphatase
VRDWVVGGAIIEDDGRLLLVQNRRRNGSLDWSPPGGVIEIHEGETLLDGLTREVEEETGLRVSNWSEPVYEVRAEAPDMGWNLHAVIHVALAFEGELHSDDPDGIVVDARFVALADCGEHLVACHPWVREPLVDWLADRWAESRPYGYRVEGAIPGAVVVTRL